MSDLAAAARDFEARHGLASIDGGRHPGWGTANRIVPFGETYLELIAVVDEDEAAASPFGRWVARERSERGTPLGWAVRTHALGAVASRRGLTVRAGSRAAPDGSRLRWRMAGIESAAADPALPFFLEWAPGAAFPGRAAASHRDGSVTIVRLELDGDAGRLGDWLGAHRLPITVRAGTPAVARVVLAGRAGELAIER